LENTYSQRHIIIQRIIVVAAVILVFKVATLQIFDSSYRQRADARTLDKKTLYPSRGLIYDRNGKLLVYNNPIYDIKAIYNSLDPAMDTARFCNLLGISEKEFVDNVEKDWGARYSRAVPFTFQKHLGPVRFAALQESMYEFPGFSEVLRNVRGYSYPYAPHTLGYMSEVNRAEVEADDGDYSPGDYIGTTGIELTYEDALRGEKGNSYVLKDNLGREVSSDQLGKLNVSPTSGVDIQISLDIELQAFGEALLNGKKGSIVCIEPATGEVLAMVSSPGYDPAVLAIHRDRSSAFLALQQDTLKPFFDRSIMAAYAPGSIFKPILALIAMQEGVLKPNRTIYCDGAYHYKTNSYGCHDHPVPYNVSIALGHSCNSYFFQTFRDIIEKEGFKMADRGLRNLNRHLGDFGLGKRLGIDLPQEKPGNIPQPEFYDQLYGKNVWRSTYILSLGIGQGELELTTLQMANLAAIIGNRGYYYTPHLIKRFVSELRVLPEDFTTQHHVKIDEKYYKPVIDGMAMAVTQGTATSAYLPSVVVCGKTGTSQNPHGKDHSVFFAFAPKDNPQIAVAVYVENGGWGSTYAVPIGGLMIEKYLNQRIAGNRKWLENRILEADLISKP
jgi:penicillin-binding protein 2